MADLLFPFAALTIIVTTQYLNVAKWRKDHLRLAQHLRFKCEGLTGLENIP